MVQSVRTQAVIVAYEDAVKNKTTRDVIVKPHELDVRQWVLVRHENPKKFESKWFGPYQIIEKMPLGMYRMHDPNGTESAALVHRNHLVKVNISMVERLRELWSSPALKDHLRYLNELAELLLSFPENTDALNRYLMEGDEEEEIVQDEPL